MLLLKAINSFSSNIKNKVKVTFVGGGPKRKKMEEFIKENNLSKIVDLLGNVSRKQVFSTLQKSDIFVLSTNWEGFPRSILEAMSIGLPIIASNVGGINEQVVNNKNGYLVPQGNEKTLKEKLIKLIKNPALREKMGQNSRKKVSEKFSLQKLHQRTCQVYKEVLSKK